MSGLIYAWTWDRITNSPAAFYKGYNLIIVFNSS